MIYIVLNAVAILAATIAGLLIGLAYSRVAGGGRTFGPGFVVLAFIAEFWLCSILAGALILAPPKAGLWTMTLGSAFVIWIGFVLPSVLVTERFRGVRTGAAIADSAHWLAVMVTQAVVLRLIGLVPPPV